MKTIDVYMRQVDIIKQINKRIIINVKIIHYNDNICIQFIKYHISIY